MSLVDFFYPMLAVCAFGILLIIAVTASGYYLVVTLDRRDRTCPQCGRTGGGRVVDSEVVDSRTSTLEPRSLLNLFRKKENKTKFVQVVETLSDHLECERCAYRWTRPGTQMRRLPSGS